MKVEKIGIITIHDTLNYGSLLQAFSLYRAVEKMGYDVQLIDYKCKAISDREKIYPLKDCCSPRGIIDYLTKHRIFSAKYKGMWEFMRANMSISSPYNRETIKMTNQLFDTFLVGSDIVWGMPVTGKDYSYMLDFTDEEKKRIAFSPSIGTPWTNEEKKIIGRLLDRFSMISMREESGAAWVRELIDKNVFVSCDPTMLWDKDFWDKLSIDTLVPSGPYVLVYMTTAEKKNIHDAIEYGKKHHMPVYYLNFNRPEFGVHNIVPMTVGEWIALFKHANTVFTASYHGMLFSLYFQKNMFYYNRGNKARMQSFGEELRLLHREGTNENVQYDEPIDYEGFVNKKIKEKRIVSWNILTKELEG